MATKTFLFIEGESNSPNGDLLFGYKKLLEQKLKGKMPRIILGDGKKQTIDKFLNNRFGADKNLLLIDLDANEIEKENDLKENNLNSKSDFVFFMIHEMEAWFLSQPEILDGFYGVDSNKKKVSDKIPNKKVSDIPNPDEFLQNLTKNSKRGTYHKIKHAVELLILLDAPKLEKDFIDFKRLIESLQ